MLARLTKSRFLKGRQCARRLWLAAHGTTEPIVETDEVWAEREAEGDEVERIAERLFRAPVRVGGPNCDDEDLALAGPLDQREAKTRAAIAGRSVVLQGHLVVDGLLAIADILEPTDDGWFVWEIKASTSEKPIHDWDLGFQWVVSERAGLHVVGAGLILLDGNYERGDGEIDPASILRRLDRTQRIRDLLPSIRAEIERQTLIIAQSAMPDERPATRCKGSLDSRDGNRPSDCGHLAGAGVCGCALPKYWVGRLPRLSGRKATTVFGLADQSIERVRALAPDLDWTEDQARCIEAVRTGRAVIDGGALRLQLQRLSWPVAYIDFEFDPGMALPRYRGCRPYDRLPFQWSMLVQERADELPVERESFLHIEDTDPRVPFAESLLAVLPTSGSIVAHHTTAETTVIRQLAERLRGDLGRRLSVLEDRFFDTETLARAGYCHADQHGSWSIKKLAPALLGTGYEDLSIQDGMAAVVAWRQMCRSTDPQTRRRLSQDLRAYCGRDTHLMHDIIERLRTYL